MKKVLYVATVDSHIKAFHLPYLKLLHDKGFEVHVATNGTDNFPYCDVKHQICIERNPLKFNNIKAVKQLRKIINDEKFDIIHCHTPMGAVVARLAAKNARKEYGAKVIYTCHGFHFFKGAPPVNWIFYYPVEKHLSKITDTIITINHEDYEIAKNKFFMKNIFLIHGVGVNDTKFNEQPLQENERIELKKELNIKDNDFCIFYVAELIKRKNQIMLIEAMKDISSINNNIKVFLVGNGALTEFYKTKIKEYGLEDKVILLGYRTDVSKLFKIADLCVSTSSYEGLGINLVEAAFSGVPLLASKIRGHNEIIKEDINGYFFDNKEELISKILMLYDNPNKLKELRSKARESTLCFSLENTYKEHSDIYDIILKYD